ncbi:MAG: hypothetical protein KatS3mg003_1088 [Candidatus Nitrosocaldaceae archaeon]|nr:MAG: hypothetical protein KatS3mg003_1088 [Candidatus Nitrosocaldaceae archaeon]
MKRALFTSIALLSLVISFSISNAYAQASEPIRMEAKSVDVELKIEPFPIEPEQQTKLDIRFVEKGSNKTQIHVDYVVSIKDAEGNEVFRTPLTHTNEGEITVPFVFLSQGSHTITVEVQGILFQPIPTETVEFSVNVVPEFPLGVLAAFGAITIIGVLMMRKPQLFTR